MAKKLMLVSDLTGEEIDERAYATITIRFPNDARKGQFHLDVNQDEIEDLIEKGQKQARRGRRPKGQE